MSFRRRFVASSVSVAFALLALTVPSGARADISESVLALAGPLTESYGVSGDAVGSLLENGLSLETVTQLLLVKESSGKSLDEVTGAYDAQGKDVDKAATELGVDADAYSEANVDAAIDKAKTDLASSATDQAKDAAGNAVGSLLGGMGKKEEEKSE